MNLPSPGLWIPGILCLIYSSVFAQAPTVAWERDSYTGTVVTQLAIALDADHFVGVRSNNDHGTASILFFEMDGSGNITRENAIKDSTYALTFVSDGSSGYLVTTFSGKVIHLSSTGEETGRAFLGDSCILSGIITVQDGYLVCGRKQHSDNTLHTVVWKLNSDLGIASSREYTLFRNAKPQLAYGLDRVLALAFAAPDGSIVLSVANSRASGADTSYLVTLSSSGDSIGSVMVKDHFLGSGALNSRGLLAFSDQSSKALVICEPHLKRVTFADIQNLSDGHPGNILTLAPAGSGFVGTGLRYAPNNDLDMIVAGFDSTGKCLWVDEMGRQDSSEIGIVTAPFQGGYLALGYRTSQGSGAPLGKLYVVKLLDRATGIHQDGKDEFEVYPNPSRAEATFRFDKSTQGSFTLYDISGRAVESASFNGNRFTIQKGNRTEGTYLYLIQAGKATYSGKIQFD
jgi:hypothetical protein